MKTIDQLGKDIFPRMFPLRNTKSFKRTLKFSEEILDISKPENINVVFLTGGIQRSHYFWGLEIGLMQLILSNSSSIIDAYELKRREFANKYAGAPRDRIISISPHFIVVVDNHRRGDERQEVVVCRMTESQRSKCKLAWCL